MTAGLAAALKAQRVERGENEHIDKRRFFQPDRVGKGKRGIDGKRKPCAAPYAQPCPE